MPLIIPISFILVYAILYAVDLLGLVGISRFFAIFISICVIGFPTAKLKIIYKKIPLVWGVILLIALIVLSVFISSSLPY